MSNNPEPTYLGKLGPDREKATARLCQRLDDGIAEGDPEPRHEPFIWLHQDTSASGCFTIMVEELPAFIATLQSLVPVVDQLASIKTP